MTVRDGRDPYELACVFLPYADEGTRRQLLRDVECTGMRVRDAAEGERVQLLEELARRGLLPDVGLGAAQILDHQMAVAGRVLGAIFDRLAEFTTHAHPNGVPVNVAATLADCMAVYIDHAFEGMRTSMARERGDAAVAALAEMFRNRAQRYKAEFSQRASALVAVANARRLWSGSDADYEEALAMVRSMGRQMARSPRTFRNMEECDLRNVHLVALNAVFGGAATAETYNVGGKTDILIRDDDRNVFIAEFKKWDGSATLTGAIDQLLDRYVGFEDTKATIVMFSHQVDFSRVVGQIPGLVAAHPRYRGELVKAGESAEWRFRIAQARDVERETVVTVLAFNLHCP